MNTAVPRVDSGLYDHTSVLKLIEWRWNIAPLTLRDASNDIANLANALNFATPDTTVPALPIVAAPIPTPCGLFELGSEVDNESYDFFKLLASDLVTAWRSAGLPIPAAPVASAVSTVETTITSTLGTVEKTLSSIFRAARTRRHSSPAFSPLTLQ